MGKYLKYLLSFFICLISLSFSVKALSPVPADGQWHDTGITFNPVNLASDSDAKGSCRTKDSGVSVRAKKTDDSILWTCEVNTSNEGNYNIEYGYIDGIGEFIGKSTVSISATSKTESSSSSSGKSAIDYNSDPRFNSKGNCKTGPLGDPENKNDTAYYLQIIFNIIKFAGPILAILFTIKDLLVMTTEQKMEGGFAKIGKKTIKRVVYAMIIFFLPIIINLIMKMVGLYTICIS